MLLGYSVWPFRIAMLSVTLANIEATVITSRLSEWRADVLSLRHLQAKQTIAATEEMQEEPLTKPGTDD